MKTIILFLSVSIVLSVNFDLKSQTNNSKGSKTCVIAPYITTQPTDVEVCEGQPASLTVVAGGDPAPTYEWFDMGSNMVSNTPTYVIPVTDPMQHNGTYYCIITNECGSSTTDYVAITVNSVMAYAGEDGAVCSGSEVNLQASGGDTYEWSGGVQQGVTFYPTSTQTYYVTVTDNFSGCTAVDDITITINDLPNAYAGEDQSVCEGYEVTLTATGGDMYEWSDDVMNGMPFIPLFSNTYTVTVTNASTWCSATDQVSVTLLPSPTVFGGPDQTVCEGSQITFTASASGGTTPYTYQWSDGVQQGVSFTPTSTQDYYVTVTGGNSCSRIDTVFLTVNMLPMGSAGFDQTICVGQNADLEAMGGDSYNWSTGSTNAAISVNPTSTQSYFVTIYSPEGCFIKDTVIVNVEQNHLVDAGTNQSVCANNSAVILSGTVTNSSGGTWSGGAGYYVNTNDLNTTYMPSQSEINSGTALLTLTSQPGACNSVSDNVTITFTLAPTVNAGSDLEICQNAFPILLDGAVTIAAGGIWSGGTGTYSPSNTSLTAGYTPSQAEINIGYFTLNLTSTGNGNCLEVTDDVTFMLTPEPLVDAGNDEIVCASNPSVNIYASVQNATGGIWTGGTGSFDPSNTSLNVTYTPSISEITAGSVTLTLTSTGNGVCLAVQDQMTITINSNPLATISSYGDASCYGTCNGFAVVEGTGGSGTYTYLWSSSAGSVTTAQANNLCAGQHEVTITDTYGCFATTNVTISQPDVLVFNVGTIVHNNCWGGHTGVINTSVVGGTDPYTFIWSNGGSTQNISGLVAGSYSVTLVDFNGCYANINNIVVNQATRIQVYVNTTNAMCNQSDGTATVTVTGGNSPYDFLFSNGQTQNPATDLAAGSYSVLVTDAYGCVSTKYFSVSNSGGFTLTGVIDDVACNNSNDGAVDVTISGGTPPFTIEWSNGQTTEDIANLTAGAYDLIVTDDVGCMGMKTFEVETISNLTYTFTTSAPNCSSSDGEITLVPSGGISPFTYTWSTGDNTAGITNVASGNYLFTITDDIGCSTTGFISLASSGGPVITIDTLIAASCGGLGSAYISVSGGTTPYTFEWSDSSTDEDIIGVNPGMYHVTVTELGGCVSVADINIPLISLPVQPICIVTVDTAAGRNMIVWERVLNSGIDYFKIYRESSIPDQYQCIANVDDTLLSEFIDLAANPFVRSFRYKMTAVDACGNESPISNYHKTLHLTMNQGIGQTYNLIWDDYEGFTYYSFIIMRYLPSTGWVNLDTLPKTLHMYTDAPSSTTGIKYLVRVDSPYPCVSSTPSIKEVGGPYSSSFSNMEDEGIIDENLMTETIYNLEISPNPATDRVFIKIPDSFSGRCNINVLTITGQSIYNENINAIGNVTLNLSGFAKGVYFVECKTDVIYRGKLIIE